MSGRAGPTFAIAFLCWSTHSHQQKRGVAEFCEPRSTHLIRRRTPITRAASAFEAFESLSLLGLGSARFGTEGDGVVAALDGFRVPELAGFIAGFGHA